MRHWFDTEFIELGYHHPCHMVSVGIVAEDGREYYAVNQEAPFSLGDQWLRENVYDNKIFLPGTRTPMEPSEFKPVHVIRQEIIDFVGGEESEWWANHNDWDWYLLAKVVAEDPTSKESSTFARLPKGWPTYCMDLKQLSKMMNFPKEMEPPEEEATKHHALHDARWDRLLYEKLVEHFDPKSLRISSL